MIFFQVAIAWTMSVSVSAYNRPTFLAFDIFHVDTHILKSGEGHSAMTSQDFEVDKLEPP
jgi:hypothetical protein